MAELIRRRTIRPSTREPSSSYKVDTKKVTAQDTLIVRIDHEEKPGEYLFTFRFNGADLANKKSIHFEVRQDISIKWIGISPLS